MGTFHKPYVALKKICIRIFELLPLQDKVVLDNFGGSYLGDDPKYIALELAKQSNIKLVWTLKVMSDLPYGIIGAKIGSIIYLYHVCTAKVWISNVRGNFNKFHKRKGQYYIQTWHACLGLKKVEAEAPSIPEAWENESKKDGEYIDLMYSNNDFYCSKYRSTFWYNGCVIKNDVPRLSVIINTPPTIKKKVFDYFNLDNRKKIILYAPTFRQDKNTEVYRWDYNRVIEAVEQKFGGNYVIMVRLHHIVASSCNFIQYSDKIINATPYPDIQELLAVADVEINDYSSSMFDFAVAEKPVFLIAKDKDEYINQDRGIEFSFEELPFPVAVTSEDLVRNIEIFDSKQYLQKLELFWDRIGFMDKGDGAKSIAKIVMEHINNTKYGEK